jgi:hypothetical protein
VLNRLPYNQRGEVMKGGAPEADLQKRIPGSPLPAWNWDAWDRRFGPLFDGSAFADLPRAGVPLELFYLPLHENWPLVFDDHFTGSYWADESLPPRYWDGFAEASRRFAEHIARRGWNRTLFHVYLNNKVDFKRNGWSRGSSIWLLDEPANFHDYWALRMFGEAFLRGRSAAESASGAAGVPLLYRCDISRPQWQRDVLDQVLDYNVIAGGAFQEDRRLVLDRQRRLGQLVIVYGTTNAPEESNVQPCAWSIDVWRQGGHGVLPWQTIGRADSWQTADRLALFYPGPSIGRKEPLPSMRLLSYTRGQQDVEYLVQAARRLGITQEECGRAIEAVLPLRGEKRGTGAGGEDAGVIDYGRLAPQQLWEFRVRTGAWLSAQASLPLADDAPGRAVPAPITRFRPPPRDPPRNTPGYVSAGDVPAR